MEYDKAWSSVVDLLVRQLDLEVLSKENGYLRTNWLYSWTGELSECNTSRQRIEGSFSIISFPQYLLHLHYELGKVT